MDIIRFERLPVPPLLKWQKDSRERMNRHWEKVSPDAGDARSLTVLVMPYAPYLPTAEGVELSAFYVASNKLHGIVGKAGLNLPVKPIIAGYGIGAYGRSGVISIPGIGTRFALAVVASDEESDPKWEWNEERPLAHECAACRMCVKKCPNGALMGDGRVDIERCLRAQAQFQEPRMPDGSRDMIGGSAWGCEICQAVCPRNAAVEPAGMPEELEKALELRKLLTGDVSGLGEWIGSNYARPARMQARSALVAANLGRQDLLPEIEALMKSQVEPVRDCAAWAINRLRHGGT